MGGEFVKAVSKFITRDIPYILGGGSVLLCIAYLFNLKLPSDLPTAWTLFGAGIAYVVGYAIQDGLSFSPLLNTSVRISPNRFLRAAFQAWSRREWNVPPSFDAWEFYFAVYKDANPGTLPPIERIITLKHIGTSMGSNWLVSGLIIGLKTWHDPSTVNYTLCGFLTGFSCLLLLLGWLQAMEMVLFYYDFSKQQLNMNRTVNQTAEHRTQADPE